jgi:N utilization substance protein B
VSANPGTARRRAREVAFRVVYQADVMAETCANVWQAAADRERLTDDQRQLVDDVVATLATRGTDVDAVLRSAAERWELPRLAATDRSVMRAAVAELMGRPGTPARVVLDEAIDIAKRFGSDESGRFVNGVLDRVVRELRPGEL